MTKFNRFDDISHYPLQTYNRAVMAFNIRDDHGVEPMKAYLDTFTKENRLHIAQLVALVKLKGTKVVKEIVTKGMVFTDEPITV